MGLRKVPIRRLHWRPWWTDGMDNGSFVDMGEVVVAEEKQGVLPTDRCEGRVEIPLGTVVKDADGADWVFVGWAVNNQGFLMSFVASVDGKKLWHQAYQYHVAMLKTALAKFPGLAQFVVPKDPEGSDV